MLDTTENASSRSMQDVTIRRRLLSRHCIIKSISLLSSSSSSLTAGFSNTCGRLCGLSTIKFKFSLWLGLGFSCDST